MPLKDPVARKTYHRNYMRNRFQTDAVFKTRHIARVRKTGEQYSKKIEAMMVAFRASGCARCPERSPCCLTAHHLDPSTKTLSLGNTGNGRYSPRQVADELAKCVCLCANCHMKVHAGALQL